MSYVFAHRLADRFFRCAEIALVVIGIVLVHHYIVSEQSSFIGETAYVVVSMSIVYAHIWLNERNLDSSPAHLQADFERSLELHKEWITSQKVRGNRLNLNGDLGSIDLSDRDLRHSIISANLRGSNLARADLREADLTGAVLWDTDLSNADLTAVKGLLTSKVLGIHPLSGADLREAKCPEFVAKFPGLENVAELSKNAGALYVSLITADAVMQLIVGQSKDLDLVAHTGSNTIPVINSSISTETFFWLGPLILLVLYLSFHLYLQRLWELIANLPAIFPDGLLLTQKTYPWLMTDMIRSGFPRIKERQQPLAPLQAGLFAALAYGVVPLSLVPFWAKYLKSHNLPITIWHITCVGLCTWCMLLFYTLGRSTRSRASDRLEIWCSRLRLSSIVSKARLFLPPMMAGFAASLCLVYVTEGFEFVTSRPSDPAELQAPIATIPAELQRIGVSSYADLAGFEISTKPDTWRDDPTIDKVASVRPNNTLSGRDLRHANMSNAFAVSCNFTKTDLTYAILDHADIRNGKFIDTRLASASLDTATMDGAVLSHADLDKANLRNASIKGVVMEGARLDLANLGNADLRNGRLKGASLVGTLLLGTKLSWAHLETANLTSANMIGADLSGASLKYASLRAAECKQASFERADMRFAHLEGAHLHEANLNGAKLLNATYDSLTEFPAGFELENKGMLMIPEQVATFRRL